MNTPQTYLITFEPGDGEAYKVLYGAPAAAFPYTLFGMAEDGDALIVVVLDGLASLSRFCRRWETAAHQEPVNTEEDLTSMAYLLYVALFRPDRLTELPERCERIATTWADDWRERLAAARARAGDHD